MRAISPYERTVIFAKRRGELLALALPWPNDSPLLPIDPGREDRLMLDLIINGVARIKREMSAAEEDIQ